MTTTNHKRKRTRLEQIFWDDVYQDRLKECMKGRKRDFGGCAHLARDQTDLALTERRNSIAGDSK